MASGLVRLSLCILLLAVSHARAATPTLELSGGSEKLRANVRAYLDIPARPCQLARWRMRAMERELDRKIDEAARALGYYHLNNEKNFERTDECWRLTLTLEPGAPVTYEQVSVLVEGAGADNPALKRALGRRSFREGEPLNHGDYESFKSRLVQVANAQGYFDADYVRAEVLVSRERNSARVNIIFDTGPRYRVGEVSVSHDILSDALIDRYITLKPGQEYRAEQLVRLKSELQASGYFGSVSVEPQLNSLSDNSVPINVDLRSGPKHSYSLGAGYASDTGPRMLLGYENRYLNSAGHSLDLNVNASRVITTYQVGYTLPMQRPAYDKLRLYTGYSQEDINKSVSNRLATGANYSTWSTGEWLNNIGLSYEEEEYAFGDDPARTSELVIPTYSTSYTTSGDVKYPRSGWSWQLQLKGASDALVSTTEFVQVHSRVKFILPLGEGRVLMRAEGGVTEVDDFGKLPISLRFFAGGDTSVRGYDYKTLGPKNNDGVVVGGSRLLTGSVEYDRRIYGNFSAAVFYDEGTAFNDGYLDPYRGVGAGLRWISPVGPVRVDIAKALDGGKGWRLHLSVGPDL